MEMKVLRQADGSETWNPYYNVRTAMEIKYHVANPTGKSDAMAAVAAVAPTRIDELNLKELRFDGYAGEGDIEATAVYTLHQVDRNNDNDADEAATMSFDCSSGTRHVNYAISQRRVYPEGEADDAHGLIGWNGKVGNDSEVEGADLPFGEMKETYTKVMRLTRLTTDYKRKVKRMVGKVNSTEFFGWLPGEMMFKGANYSTPLRGAKTATVTFQFDIQENEDKAEVCGINCGAKQGFEYIWMRYKTKVNDGAVSAEPAGVYIATVCKTAEFRELGL